MIYIVHGDDFAKSRYAAVNQLRQNTGNISEYELKELTADRLRALVNSPTLFGAAPFILIDITSARPSNELDKIILALSAAPQDTTIILLSSKPLSTTNPFIKAKIQLKAKVIENKLVPNSNIFKFLDELFSKNRTGTYTELFKLESDGEESMKIFSMILYELRNTAFCVGNSPRPEKLSPFAKTKSISHAKNYTEGEIRELFKFLHGLDVKYKTGEIPVETMITFAVEKCLGSQV